MLKTKPISIEWTSFIYIFGTNFLNEIRSFDSFKILNHKQLAEKIIKFIPEKRSSAIYL